MYMSLHKLGGIVKDRKACCAAIMGSQRVSHSWVTEQHTHTHTHTHTLKVLTI